VTLLFASDSGDQRPDASSSETATAGFVKTPPVAGTVIESIGVTAFKVFLACPYLFQLQSDRRLRLGDLDERASELDSRGFGTLVHSALERWGREEAAGARPTEDAGAIERSALEHLDRFVAVHYPKSRVPALRVQIELARRRLRRFAEIQAEQARQGWKVHLIELSFDPGAKAGGAGALESPRLPAATGLYLKGRIDRVDLNMGTGAFRAVDYKTSATADPPTRTHVRGGRRKKSTGMIEWKDLQLPLYRVLLRSMPEPVVVGAGDLGYINLAPSAEKSGFSMFDPKVIIERDLDAAEELAIEIVGKIQRCEFTPSKRIPVPAGDPLGAIWGRGQRGLSDAAGAEGGEE
jgi:ATP-dependent helicase/nuclease subunit B